MKKTVLNQITTKLISFLVLCSIFFQTGGIPVKADFKEAPLNATYNTELWQTVTFDSKQYEIWLVSKPNEPLPSGSEPLMSSEHYSSVESIYVTYNGDRVDDPSLEFEVLFLAQNNLLLSDQSIWESWATNLSTAQEDGEIVYIDVDSVSMPFFIPAGVNPNNGTKEDVIAVLSNEDKRIELYEQLIRSITHPGLEIDGVYEIEEIFGDEMGWIYDYAIWYANNSEFDKLTQHLGWFGAFAEGMEEASKVYCETYYVAVDLAPQFLQNAHKMSGGFKKAAQVLDVLEIADNQLDTLTRYVATIIYVQSTGYKRLDAFEWAVQNYRHSVKDPALNDAIQNIRTEYDSFINSTAASVIWDPFFTNILLNYNPDAVGTFIDVVALIGSIYWVNVIPGYGHAIGAAWAGVIILTKYFVWAGEAPSIIAHAGLALELEYVMEEALKVGFKNRNSSSDLLSLRPLVLSINQRYFAGWLFYKILIQRYRTNDDLYIHHWFDQDLAPPDPILSGNVRLDKFVYSLPVAYIETENSWVGVAARGPAITDVTPTEITDYSVGDVVPIRVQFIVNATTEKVECRYYDYENEIHDSISTDTSGVDGWGCDWDTSTFSAGIYGLQVLVTDENGYDKSIPTHVRLIGQQLPVINSVQVTPNKSQYDLGETVSLGIQVEDNDNLSVTGASLSFSVDGTAYSCSDSGVACNEIGGGDYSINFPAPSLIQDYDVDVTASKSDYLPGTGSTTITVVAPYELGHDVFINHLSISRSGSTLIKAQASVYNGGSYIGTASESVKIEFRLRNPNGIIIDTETTSNFSVAKTYSSSLYTKYLSLPSNPADGNYYVEAVAIINGQIDEKPSNNKGTDRLWIGDKPEFSEYGLDFLFGYKQQWLKNSTGGDDVDGYKIFLENAVPSYDYAYIDLYNGSRLLEDILQDNERIDEKDLRLFDGNNLALILDSLTTSGENVPGATIVLGAAGNTDVTFTPGTAVVPAGTQAVFRVQGPTGHHLKNFVVEIDASGDDFNIVKNWGISTERVDSSADDLYLSFMVPWNTSPRTYEFWLSFDDSDTDFDTIIRKLFIEVQPPHNIVSSVTPSGQTVTVGDVVPIQATIQNTGGYTEYGIVATATITGPNGYVQTYSDTISSLANGSSTTRTFNWPTSGLRGGTYNIKVEAPLSLDAYPSDNTRTVSNTLSSPPTLIVDASTDKSSYVQAESIDLSATVRANSNPISGSTVTYFVKSSSGQTVSSGQMSDQSNGSYTSTISAPLNVDTYSITVSASKSGYVNGNDQIAGITVVTAPPQTTLLTVSPEEGELITYNDLGFDWSGADLVASANQLEYAYKLDSGLWSGFSSGASVFFSDLLEGTHTFYVKTRVVGGMEDPTPATRSFTIDTLSPVFEISPVANASVYQNSEIIQIEVDLDGSADVYANFNTVDSNFNLNNVTVTETDITNHLYTISYPISANNAKPDQTYLIIISATDQAGNTSYESLSVKLDNYFPEIDIQRPAGTSISNGGTDNFGNQFIGQVSQTYTLDNTSGTGELIISAITPSNVSNISDFSVNATMPIVVPSGAVETFDISFFVNEAGAFSLDLGIINNDVSSTPYNINIQGVGTLGLFECQDVIFEDDFSTDKGWENTSLSEAIISRDPTNEWVSWAVSRNTPLHYFYPINTDISDDIQLSLRYKIGDGKGVLVYMGLAESANELSPPVNGGDMPGVFLGPNHANDIELLSLYTDYPPTHLSTGISYDYGVWINAILRVSEENWYIELRDDNDTLLGIKEGALTQGHSSYNYVMFMFDYEESGRDHMTGYIDDVSVCTSDTTFPDVASITRADANPTNTTNVDFTVTFSEPITGVGTTAPFNDFSLTTTGVRGASVTGVSGSGDTYTVTVNTGSGNGAIRLDVVDDDSILDEVGNSLGGVGVVNGDYSSGEEYTIEKSNDFIENPFNILEKNNYQNKINTEYATVSISDPIPPDGCGISGKGQATVWYKYTPDANTAISLDTFGSDYNTFIAVWTGIPGNLDLVDCNNDAGGTEQSAVSIRVTGGKTYYIEIGQP
jgi:hypothetical protein